MGDAETYICFLQPELLKLFLTLLVRSFRKNSVSAEIFWLKGKYCSECLNEWSSVISSKSHRSENHGVMPSWAAPDMIQYYQQNLVSHIRGEKVWPQMGNKIASQERGKYFTCELLILVDFRTGCWLSSCGGNGGLSATKSERETSRADGSHAIHC